MIPPACNKANTISKTNGSQRRIWIRPVLSLSEEQQLPSLFSGALSVPSSTIANKKKKKNMNDKKDSLDSSSFLKYDQSKHDIIIDDNEHKRLNDLPPAFKSSPSLKKCNSTKSITTEASSKAITKQNIDENDLKQSVALKLKKDRFLPGSTIVVPQKKKDERDEKTKDKKKDKKKKDKKVSSATPSTPSSTSSSKRTKHQKDDINKSRLSSSSTLLSSAVRNEDDGLIIDKTPKNRKKKKNDAILSIQSPSKIESSNDGTTNRSNRKDSCKIHTAASKNTFSTTPKRSLLSSSYKYLGTPTPKSAGAAKNTTSKNLSVFSKIPKKMQHQAVDDTRLRRSRDYRSNSSSFVNVEKGSNDSRNNKTIEETTNRSGNNNNCIDSLTTQQRIDLIRALFKMQEEMETKELATKPIDIALGDDALSVLKKAKMENDRIINDMEDYDDDDSVSSSSSCTFNMNDYDDYNNNSSTSSFTYVTFDSS